MLSGTSRKSTEIEKEKVIVRSLHMAELNLKQIIDKLNTEFTGETRKLVFWYDDKAEFVEAFGMGKDLSKMTLEELWALFPIFLVPHDDRWNIMGQMMS